MNIEPLSSIVKTKNSVKKVPAGINGFGRVGLRLLRHWLLHQEGAGFSIVGINEIRHTPKELARIIKNDAVAGILPHTIRHRQKSLFIEGVPRIVISSAEAVEEIPWSDRVRLVFECTGKFTERDSALRHMKNRVEKVLVSATSLSADALIVLGVNHHEYHPKRHHVISYGSCTVNAYIPLAKVLHDAFSIEESDVHIIHSTPLRDIQPPFGTISRRGCTLEYVAPRLLPCLENHFYVTYRLIPYPGVSLMDIRFRFKKTPSVESILEIIEEAARGSMDIHLEIDRKDKDPNHFIGNSSSAIVIASEIKVKGKDVLLSAWFDNENSATRLFDLANFIINQIE